MIGELALRPLVLVVAASATEVAAASDLGLCSLGEMELVLCKRNGFFCFKMIMRDMLITFIRMAVRRFCGCEKTQFVSRHIIMNCTEEVVACMSSQNKASSACNSIGHAYFQLYGQFLETLKNTWEGKLQCLVKLKLFFKFLQGAIFPSFLSYCPLKLVIFFSWPP